LRSFASLRMTASGPYLSCSEIERLGKLVRSSAVLSECDGDEWVAAFAPAVQTALKRANPLYPILPEEQRHTGAGSFVWSSTVENHFAVARQTVVLLFQLLGIHAESAGNGFRVGFEVHGMAQVHDH